MPPTLRLILCLTPLLVISWVSLAWIDPRPDVAVGYFLGSLYAHVTLSAAWVALGPGWVIVRLPATLIWMLINALVIVINTLHSGIEDSVWMLCVCMALQWLVLQLPLWGLAWGLGLRLRHGTSPDRATTGPQVQFGIRHLLIVMGIVGVVLGVGRVVAPHVVLSDPEGPLLLFLSLAAILMTLPVLLSVLMRRMALLGALLSLLLVAAMTAAELPLVNANFKHNAESTIFIIINIASAALVLLIAAIVRANGFYLELRQGHSVGNHETV